MPRALAIRSRPETRVRRGRHLFTAAVVAALGAVWPATAAEARDVRASAVRTKLPLVVVNTPRAIRDDPKIRARMRVIDHRGRRNTVRSSPNGYNGVAGIELRGQSSQALFPKKSYALELRKGGENRSVGLLGMPADDDWVLYAGYNDKTLMRNAVAYETSRFTGRWAARSQFVELVLNGRYRGVYVLMERPEIGDDRVNTSNEGLTGAYLLEFTFPFQARTKGPYFRTPIKRRPIVYDDPEYADMSKRERRYIRTTVNRAERALYRGGRTGWRRHLDAAAAADYVLVQELFRNVDAFHGSTFLTKSAGELLALGPVWDFDLSSGNSTAGNSLRTRGWWTRHRDWAERLHRDVGFRRALRTRWRELRENGLRKLVLRTVDKNAAVLRGGPARRNFARWRVLRRRVWQNPAARGSFAREVRYLRGWLNRRIAWMDRALGLPRE